MREQILAELDKYINKTQGKSLKFEEIDEDLLKNFLISLGNKESTLNNKIRILNKEFGTSLELFKVNFRKEVLYPHEIQQIEDRAVGKYRIRNLALFFLILDTGIDLEDIPKITPDMIPERKNELFYFNNNSYKLSEKSLKYLSKLLKTSRKTVLFHGQKGPLERRGLQQALNKLGKGSKIHKTLNYKIIKDTHTFNTLKSDENLYKRVFQMNVNIY